MANKGKIVLRKCPKNDSCLWFCRLIDNNSNLTPFSLFLDLDRSVSLCLCRMLNWVVKVVPQPPEPPSKIAEGPKGGKQSAAPPVAEAPPPPPVRHSGTVSLFFFFIQKHFIIVCLKFPHLIKHEAVFCPQQEKKVKFQDECKNEGETVVIF